MEPKEYLTKRFGKPNPEATQWAIVMERINKIEDLLAKIESNLMRENDDLVDHADQTKILRDVDRPPTSDDIGRVVEVVHPIPSMPKGSRWIMVNYIMEGMSLCGKDLEHEINAIQVAPIPPHGVDQQSNPMWDALDFKVVDDAVIAEQQPPF